MLCSLKHIRNGGIVIETSHQLLVDAFIHPVLRLLSPAILKVSALLHASSVRLRRGQTCPLFLHTAAGMNPVRRVPGSQDTAVPAVGADSVSHRRSVRQHTSPPRIRAASHRLRGCFRFSDVASYLYSTVCACSRIPLYPASRSVRAHSLGPSRPRPRRRSPSPRCRSLSGSGSL